MIENWRSMWLGTLRKHPGEWIIQGQEGWRVGRLYWHPKANNDNGVTSPPTAT